MNDNPLSPALSPSEGEGGSALTLGAIYLGEGRCQFRVWAPEAKVAEVVFLSPAKRVEILTADERGYHASVVEGVRPGARYFYRLDGKLERPDPASRFQPDGVHGPSVVLEPSFEWADQEWFGPELRDYVIYELHVGTFTPEGTLDAVIPRLAELRDLGITAIELMPVAQFPGGRNWGYDGVFPFAAQSSYGGPAGLKRLVNAAHRAGLAVVLDVVYNHLGPEGNYLADFAPYFTDRYHTPWGRALNFDGPDSDEVRRYFNENALCWQTEFHLDALRLDAIHAIRDFSATPFLQELAAATHRQAERLNRQFHVIAESDLNDARFILPTTSGGLGLDAQWSDDFHHALHVLLTGEQAGYYADFEGVAMLAKTIREGYAYTGEYSVHRRCRHGNSPRQARAKQFVVCAQNHDQIGNRLLGDRLAASLSFEAQKLAAGAVVLSPFVPLLFMGEEYGETAPFQYFTSHSDPDLVEAVREGRKREFASFGWKSEVPDPQAEETFQRCKLNWSLREQGRHAVLREFYRELIALRASLSALAGAEKESVATTVFERERVLCVRYGVREEAPLPGPLPARASRGEGVVGGLATAGEVILVLAFGGEAVSIGAPIPAGRWKKRLDSAAPRWGGPGSSLPDRIPSNGGVRLELGPHALAVFEAH